jgi:hypothetical protein
MGSRLFAYNSGGTIIGTSQSGNLAISNDSKGGGSVQWWAGPNEDLGYVIGYPDTSGTRKAAGVTISGNSVGFMRTTVKTNAAFLAIANYLTNQGFLTASVAANWLNTNGYYTTYVTIDGSLSFNGTNQSLGLSPGIIFGAGAFTLEGWFYNTSNFTNRGIIGSPVTSPVGCMNLHFSDSQSIYSDKNGGGGQKLYTMASAVTTNAWHYLIYNRNSDGTTAVYIDGVRAGSAQSDTLNYNTASDTIGRDYLGYWPGYWTNMRIRIGTAVYNSNNATQTNPSDRLESLSGTRYLMLGSTVTTDSSGIQTVTNNNGVSLVSNKPF